MPRVYRDCEACGGRSSEHPTRHIEFGVQSACVDDQLADLIVACWRAGITTTESCQDFWFDYMGDDRPEPEVFLSFGAAEDLVHFGDALLRGDDTRDPWSDAEPRPWPGWGWTCHPGWFTPSGSPEEVCGFVACVTFPPEDLDEVTRRIVASAA